MGNLRTALLALLHACLKVGRFYLRKDIQQAASAPHGDSLVYSGTSRNLNKKEKDANTAIKQPAQIIRVPDQLIEDLSISLTNFFDIIKQYRLLDQGRMPSQISIDLN